MLVAMVMETASTMVVLLLATMAAFAAIARRLAGHWPLFAKHLAFRPPR